MKKSFNIFEASVKAGPMDPITGSVYIVPPPEPEPSSEADIDWFLDRGPVKRVGRPALSQAEREYDALPLRYRVALARAAEQPTAKQLKLLWRDIKRKGSKGRGYAIDQLVLAKARAAEAAIKENALREKERLFSTADRTYTHRTAHEDKELLLALEEADPRKVVVTATNVYDYGNTRQQRHKDMREVWLAIMGMRGSLTSANATPLSNSLAPWADDYPVE